MTTDQTNAIATPATAPDNAKRRQLLRASLATGPVIATLASPSVFAGDCVAPSQTLSAARSHATSQLGSCGIPDSCDTWKSRLGNTACSAQERIWRDTTFHSVFTQQGSADGCRMTNTSTGGVAKMMTFYEVLCLPGSTAGTQLARQFAAAYLNICSNKVLFPVNGSSSQANCAQAVVTVWNEWARNGSYSPYAGASAWTNTKISYYLQNFVPSA